MLLPKVIINVITVANFEYLELNPVDVSNSVPELESINDRNQIDWDLQQDLNRKLLI